MRFFTCVTTAGVLAMASVSMACGGSRIKVLGTCFQPSEGSKLCKSDYNSCDASLAQDLGDTGTDNNNIASCLGKDPNDVCVFNSPRGYSTPVAAWIDAPRYEHHPKARWPATKYEFQGWVGRSSTVPVGLKIRGPLDLLACLASDNGERMGSNAVFPRYLKRLQAAGSVMAEYLCLARGRCYHGSVRNVAAAASTESEKGHLEDIASDTQRELGAQRPGPASGAPTQSLDNKPSTLTHPQSLPALHSITTSSGASPVSCAHHDQRLHPDC
ncbi:hypothetical protein JHW43_002257 [Diplocarpon mali]|nr:hypothetical protein JHW43_002257 [Diplocarpon mali]